MHRSNNIPVFTMTPDKNAGPPRTRNMAPATPRMLRNASGNTLTARTPDEEAAAAAAAARPQALPRRSHSSPWRPVPPPQQQQPAPVPNPVLLPPADMELPQRQPLTGHRQPRPAAGATASSAAPPLQFHRKLIGDWDFVKTVGAGLMGKVKLARHRRTNDYCAVKIVPRAAKLYQRAHAHDPPASDAHEAAKRAKEYEKEVARDKRTIREGALGRLLYHPFVCRLYEMIPMTNHYYMLFEYVQGGQMLDYIVLHGLLKERHAQRFARGVALALDYCHRNNVVHRDLKIENIMIAKLGDIKLIDFGLSNMYDFHNVLKTYCGLLYFAAPELLSARPYVGPEVDVWLFGVVLYVLVCGKVPFDDPTVSVLHEKIKRGRVEYPDHLSRECVLLLSQMLVVRPEARALLRTVMNHPWMTAGYDAPPPLYMPRRVPIALPLDRQIVRDIVALGMGTEEQITQDLTDILSLPDYQQAMQHWYSVNTGASAPRDSDQDGAGYADPTNAYHPLLSIYYLVEEMRKRRRAKEEARANEAVQPPAGPQAPPTPTPVVELRSALRLSPLPQEIPRQVGPLQQFSNQQLPPPQSDYMPQLPEQVRRLGLLNRPLQEPVTPGRLSTTPVAAPGLGLVLRKQRDPETPRNDVSPAVPRIQVPKTSPSGDLGVRRGVSMKVTLKEKLAGAQTADFMDVAKQQRQQQDVVVLLKYATKDTLDPGKLRRQYHPLARAKSVGGSAVSARSDSARYVWDAQQVPPLPKHVDPLQYAQPRTERRGTPLELRDLGADGFFDDITLESELRGGASRTATASTAVEPPKPLTELEIMEEAQHARAGSMPSIEYPRTLFLKGFFSVQTTSTKALPIIRYDIIQILSNLGVQFEEVKGGFVCTHTPSIDQLAAAVAAAAAAGDSGLAPLPSSGNSHQSKPSMEEEAPQALPVQPDLRSHRRKFSLGTTLLLHRRKNELQPGVGAVLWTPGLPNTQATPDHLFLAELDDSLDLISGQGMGHLDMFVQLRVDHKVLQADGMARQRLVRKARTPLQFEIHLVKVPLVGLHGVQFKKVKGNTWMYKTLAGEILKDLRL